MKHAFWNSPSYATFLMKYKKGEKDYGKLIWLFDESMIFMKFCLSSKRGRLLPFYLSINIICYVCFDERQKGSLDICSLIIFYNDIMELLIIFGYIIGLPWSCDLRYDLVMERIIKLA